MTHKLTKNDRISTANYDLTMIIEKFEQLLRCYNVYHIYYATFYERYIDELCSNLYDEWRNWADNVNPKNWISFVKDCDPNPNRLIDWAKINSNWRELLDSIINNNN